MEKQRRARFHRAVFHRKNLLNRRDTLGISPGLRADCAVIDAPHLVRTNQHLQAAVCLSHSKIFD